jgi:hypothetical protein
MSTCSACGHPTGDGRFCSNCGQPSLGTDAAPLDTTSIRVPVLHADTAERIPAQPVTPPASAPSSARYPLYADQVPNQERDVAAPPPQAGRRRALPTTAEHQRPAAGRRRAPALVIPTASAGGAFTFASDPAPREVSNLGWGLLFAALMLAALLGAWLAFGR